MDLVVALACCCFLLSGCITAKPDRASNSRIATREPCPQSLFLYLKAMEAESAEDLRKAVSLVNKESGGRASRRAIGQAREYYVRSFQGCYNFVQKYGEQYVCLQENGDEFLVKNTKENCDVKKARAEALISGEETGQLFELLSK